MSSGGVRVQWFVTLGLAALSAFLGYTGLAEYVCASPEFCGAGPVDLAYYTAQLFVFDSAPVGAGPFPPALQVALFLAPLTTLLAVVLTVARLFRDWIRSERFRRSRGHVIVIGNEPSASLLARRLAAERTKVVLVGTALPAEHARRHKLLIVPGDPTDRETLDAAGVRRAGAVYALSPIGATNAKVALAVRSMREHPTATIGMYAQVGDDVLVAAMRSLWGRFPDTPQFDLGFFVLEDVAARVLLDVHPPVPEDGVVIAGFGAFPQAVLREIGRRHRGLPGRMRVRVVTANEATVTALQPDLDAAGVDLARVARMPEQVGRATVYICYADADEVLRAGLGQQRAGVEHVVMCLRHLSELDAEGLHDQRIFDDTAARPVLFGILDEALSTGVRDTGSGERLRDARIDRLARALHARYLGMSHDAAPGPFQVPWGQLPGTVRVDNYAQAEHIVTKLAGIGARVVPLGPGFVPFAFRPGEVEALAEQEHERWTAAKEAQGFGWGPTRTDTEHPDMRSWTDLPEARRDIDRQFVRALPDVLAEAGFQIVRTPPT